MNGVDIINTSLWDQCNFDLLGTVRTIRRSRSVSARLRTTRTYSSYKAGVRYISQSASGRSLTVGPIMKYVPYICTVHHIWQLILVRDPKNEPDSNLQWTTPQETVWIERISLKTSWWPRKFWIKLIFISTLHPCLFIFTKRFDDK
jgi:hypothetical protein